MHALHSLRRYMYVWLEFFCLQCTYILPFRQLQTCIFITSMNSYFLALTVSPNICYVNLTFTLEIALNQVKIRYK